MNDAYEQYYIGLSGEGAYEQALVLQLEDGNRRFPCGLLAAFACREHGLTRTLIGISRSTAFTEFWCFMLTHNSTW